MNIKTGRFGQLAVLEEDKITIPQGILGFPDLRNYCLVDPGDDTLILWLQSLDDPQIAFPVLEPKIFKPDYAARLSSNELRELKLDTINHSAVFSILTIPENITQMTANLKAPVVLNLKQQVGKQVVLQENEYAIKHPMFKELRAHIVTILAHRRSADPKTPLKSAEDTLQGAVISIKAIPPSLTVKSLSG